MEAEQIETRTLITSLTIIVSIEWAMRVVISKHLFDEMITIGVTRLLEITLIIFFLIWGQGVSSIGLEPSKMVPGFRRGLVWSAGFGIVACVAFVVLYMLGINIIALIQARPPTKPGKIILFFFVGGMLGPIAEEIFFRGILYGFLRQWGVLFALTLSTLLFVLIHPMSHGIFLPQLVGGILFALSYEVEGTLFVPMTIHILGYTAIFTLSFVT